MASPRRIKIHDQWYDTSEWAGSLELHAYGSPIRYKASEPYAHVSNLYYVYDSDGSKVGEFDINNNTYSGCVTDFET